MSNTSAARKSTTTRRHVSAPMGRGLLNSLMRVSSELSALEPQSRTQSPPSDKPRYAAAHALNIDSTHAPEQVIPAAPLRDSESALPTEHQRAVPPMPPDDSFSVPGLALSAEPPRYTEPLLPAKPLRGPQQALPAARQRAAAPDTSTEQPPVSAPAFSVEAPPVSERAPLNVPDCVLLTESEQGDEPPSQPAPQWYYRRSRLDSPIWMPVAASAALYGDFYSQVLSCFGMLANVMENYYVVRRPGSPIWIPADPQEKSPPMCVPRRKAVVPADFNFS